MSRSSKGIALLVLLLAGATALAADAKPKASNERPSMIAEIFQLDATAAAKIAGLYEEFQRAPDEAAAVAIQRRIEALQRSNEAEILLVQLRHAREEGRLDAVHQLESVLSILRSNETAAN